MFVVRVVVKRHSKWFYCGNCDELLGVLRHGVFSKRFWMGKKAAEAGRPWAFEVREPPVECPCCMRPGPILEIVGRAEVVAGNDNTAAIDPACNRPVLRYK